MANKIEAAIFDIDGMLLDTREFILRAYEHALETHGHDVPDRDVIASHMGKTLRTCYEIFVPGEDTAHLRATHSQFQTQNTHLIEAYDGLPEMLTTLQEARIKIGLVSSRFGEAWHRNLQEFGLANRVGVAVAGDQVTRHKPHPEGLLHALKVLQVEPAAASMSGDTVQDIQAGQAAGVAVTIAVTHGFGEEQALRQAEPDFVVHSLAEVPPILLGED